MATPLIYPPTSDFLQKTLGAALSQGTTAAATLNNVTGIQNLKGIMIIDRVDSNGIETPSKVEIVSFAGTSGSTVVTLVRGLAGTSDQDHAISAVVEFGPDILQQQAIIDGMLQLLTTAGAIDTTKVVDLTTAQTLTNKVATSTTNNLAAKALHSASTVVDVVAATAPSTGQVLMATDSTHATWQTPASGGDWTSYSAVTPTRASADAPSYVLTFAGVDLTSTLYLGMKIRITQSTVKYFIITKISFSTDTTVTVYGGTDYTVADTGVTAITAFAYSTAKAPAGFNVDPSKWTQEFTDTGNRSQATPSNATWYNIQTATLAIPIGVWNVQYAVVAAAVKNGVTSVTIYTTLSTANNTQSDAYLSTFSLNQAGSANLGIYVSVTRQKLLALTSKTSYFLNTQSDTADTLYNRGDLGTTRITAVCAYL